MLLLIQMFQLCKYARNIICHILQHGISQEDRKQLYMRTEHNLQLHEVKIKFEKCLHNIKVGYS